MTFLELLDNFVVVSGCLPPVCLRGSAGTRRTYVDALSPEGCLEPVPLRESIVAFVAIAHFVRKHVAVNAWPSAVHSKLRTLQLLGQTSTRKGVLKRPVMEQRQATGFKEDILVRLYEISPCNRKAIKIRHQ